MSGGGRRSREAGTNPARNMISDLATRGIPPRADAVRRELVGLGCAGIVAQYDAGVPSEPGPAASRCRAEHRARTANSFAGPSAKPAELPGPNEGEHTDHDGGAQQGHHPDDPPGHEPV